MLDKTTFQNWLSDFFNTKSNELEYSRVSQPKRMEKITLNLATASGDPFQINVPFRTMIVSRIYSTAVTTTDKAGTIKIMFDQDNISNIKNAISLFPNDTLRSGTLVTKAFLSWDAQSDTSVDLYFYPDIEVIAGTTKTQIVGSVSVINTSATAMYNRPAIPYSREFKAVANSAVTTSFTAVPAGYYGKFSITAQTAPGGNVTGTIDGVNFLQAPSLAAATVSTTIMNDVTVVAGEVVAITTLAAGNSFSARLEVFPLA